ncbi:MAG: peptide chain release factor N(5)-glutamine methyltransferase [Fimbriimonas sp.]
MNVGEWLNRATQALDSVGIESARLEAQVMVAHVTRTDRSWVAAHPEAEFPDLAAESMLIRRCAREPLAYILGYREFWGRRFSVTSDVLIPRQDTETLVEWALNRDGSDSSRVLDIGTGSGCIAITLKLERPRWQVTGVDLSPRALAVARRNGEALGAEVTWLESDLGGAVAGEQFDLIVCNPPYIATGTALMPEVSEFEPPSALFAGRDGLGTYRRLAEQAKSLLAPAGVLALEIGFGQQRAVTCLLKAEGWEVLEAIPDLSGIVRVLVARL